MIARAFIATWVLLGVLQVAYHAERPLLAGLMAAPILLTAVFLRPHRPRRLFLATLVSLPYFVHGAMEWTVQSDPLMAAAEVMLCIVLYLLLIADGARRRRGT